MHDLIERQLPLYIAGVLPADEQARVEQHLQQCASCRQVAHEWRILAQAVRAEVATSEMALPPLSPVVRGTVRHRPTWGEAVRATLTLVWAQRVVVLRGGIVPAVVLVLLVGLVATLGLRDRSMVALPRAA